MAEAGRLWGLLTDKDKEPYVELAEKDKKRYAKQQAEYEEKGYYTLPDGSKSTDLVKSKSAKGDDSESEEEKEEEVAPKKPGPRKKKEQKEKEEKENAKKNSKKKPKDDGSSEKKKKEGENLLFSEDESD